MKKNPIVLGITALSALGLLVACNVDPNRVDKDAVTTRMKNVCERSPEVMNLEKVYADREAKTGVENKKGIAAVTRHGYILADLEFDILPIDSADRVELNNINCQELTADLSIPKGPGGDTMLGAKITNIGLNSMELEHEGETIKVELLGFSGLMSDMSEEDGYNQIRIARKAKDGSETVIYNETVPTAGYQAEMLEADMKKIGISKKAASNSDQLTYMSVKGEPIEAVELPDGRVAVDFKSFKTLVEQLN